MKFSTGNQIKGKIMEIRKGGVTAIVYVAVPGDTTLEVSVTIPALETLKLYEERQILDHVGKVTPVLQEGVRRFAGHPLVGEVRGVGLIAGIELVRDKAAKTAFPAPAGAGALVASKCQEAGVILRSLGDTIAFCPPLVITPAEIEEMLARFERGLDAATAELRRRGDVLSA